MLLIQHSVQDLFVFLFFFFESPHSSVFIAEVDQPLLLCCRELQSKGRVPKTAAQLSEAVVGGRVPWRLAQQTVCGVL